jgi:hypothetical protein
MGARKPTCPDTGLTVPECSCSRCLEAMLREMQPALLESEIKVTRLAAHHDDGPDALEDRRAA